MFSILKLGVIRVNAFNFLTSDCKKKPGTGLTMMLDKGIGLMSLIDF